MQTICQVSFQPTILAVTLMVQCCVCNLSICWTVRLTETVRRNKRKWPMGNWTVTWPERSRSWSHMLLCLEHSSLKTAGDAI